MRFAVAVVVSMLFAVPARADVIDSTWRPPSCPPVSCALGASTIGAGSHSGCSPGCGPSAACEADAECVQRLGDGATCVDTRFCIGEVFVSRMGQHPFVHGECAADNSCEAGECSVARRCARPPAPPPTPPSPRAAPATTPTPATVPQPRANDSRGCAASPGGHASWLGCGALAAALLLRRRRPPG